MNAATAKQENEKIERERAIAAALREWRWALRRLELARQNEERRWQELQGFRAVGARMLSTRERQVFDMIRARIGNKEIAHRLSISVSTVKFHLAAIFRKLGMASRKDLTG